MSRKMHGIRITILFINKHNRSSAQVMHIKHNMQQNSISEQNKKSEQQMHMHKNSKPLLKCENQLPTASWVDNDEVWMKPSVTKSNRRNVPAVSTNKVCLKQRWRLVIEVALKFLFLSVWWMVGDGNVEWWCFDSNLWWWQRLGFSCINSGTNEIEWGWIGDEPRWWVNGDGPKNGGEWVSCMVMSGKKRVVSKVTLCGNRMLVLMDERPSYL